MGTIFPAANERVPDLFNAKIIHQEITELETLVMNARYEGERELLAVTSTDFTDPTIASPIELANTVDGTETFTDGALVLDPGMTLKYNDSEIIFVIEVIGDETFADYDDTVIITTSGNLVFSGTSDYSVGLVNTYTLKDVVEAINEETESTGVRAFAELNADNDPPDYSLHLVKDSTENGSDLEIKNTSLSDILTDLGLSVGTTVIDVDSIVDQIGSDASKEGAGPYSISLSNSNGIYVREGDAATELGLAFTVNLTTNLINIEDHGLVTGDRVSFTTPGVLPVPLNAFPDSFYFVIRIDDDSFKVATTLNNALNTVPLDLTQQGTDYFTVKGTSESETYFQVWKAYAENRVYKQRMDEVIKHFEDRDYIIYRQTNPDTEATMQWVIKW